MRVALLGSGRGSNADAVLRAQAEGSLGKAKVIGIWCDVATCKMLELGPKYGVPARFLDTGPFKTKFSPEREQAWADDLKAAKVDLIVLAGFMRVIKAPLLDAFAGRIINLHPSLLPAFPASMASARPGPLASQRPAALSIGLTLKSTAAPTSARPSYPVSLVTPLNPSLTRFTPLSMPCFPPSSPA